MVNILDTLSDISRVSYVYNLSERLTVNLSIIFSSVSRRITSKRRASLGEFFWYHVLCLAVNFLDIL